jgi:hypothetical protein
MPRAAASDIASQVTVGDVVRAELANGQRVRLTVRSVAGDALLGEGNTRVAYVDIIRLERESVNGTRTLLLNLPLIILVSVFIVMGAGLAEVFAPAP